MKVSLVIVNWNTGQLLKKCLASLEGLPEKDVIEQVIVVDNTSTDSSFTEAKNRRYAMPVKFLEQKRNIGFARANNIGIRKIRKGKKEYPHILLLNPDTEVKPGALAALLNTLDRYPKAGVVGPKLINPDGSTQPSVRRFPTVWTFIMFFLKLPRLVRFLPVWKKYMMIDFDYQQEKDVDQVMGAAFLIRDAVLQNVGLLDEHFWIWFEEVDFCKRVKEAGWDVMYTPTATILHHGGVSFSQVVGLRKTKPFIQSARRYARKHLWFTSYLVLLLLTPINYLLTVPATLWHVVWRKKNKKRL